MIVSLAVLIQGFGRSAIDAPSSKLIANEGQANAPRKRRVLERDELKSSGSSANDTSIRRGFSLEGKKFFFFVHKLYLFLDFVDGDLFSDRSSLTNSGLRSIEHSSAFRQPTAEMNNGTDEMNKEVMCNAEAESMDTGELKQVIRFLDHIFFIVYVLSLLVIIVLSASLAGQDTSRKIHEVTDIRFEGASIEGKNSQKIIPDVMFNFLRKGS